MGIFDSLEEVETPGPPKSVLQRVKGLAFTKKVNSIALVAANGGAGVILEWHGNDIFWSFEGDCGCEISTHGMDDAPDGLSIWTGHMFCDESHTDMGHEYEAYLDGTFRPLTSREWQLLQDIGVPWELEPCDHCGQEKCTCNDGEQDADTDEGSVP